MCSSGGASLPHGCTLSSQGGVPSVYVEGLRYASRSRCCEEDDERSNVLFKRQRPAVWFFMRSILHEVEFAINLSSAFNFLAIVQT